MGSDESIKVSIIVPVHNAAETLSTCVNSIVGQNYKNIECVLIENGSTDRSKLLCLEFASMYNNVVVASNHELGVSNARNKGLSIATGEIIGFCDSDDFIEPNAIQVVAHEFKKEPKLITIIGAFYVGNRNKEGLIKKYFGLKSRRISARTAMQLTLVNDSIMGSVWNKYYRADVLKNQRFDPNLSFCEDMHFNLKALDSVSKGSYVKLTEIPLYCYIDNAQSVTHKKNILFDEKDELKYIVALKAIMRDCHLDRKMITLLRMKIACFSIDTIESMDLNNKKRKKLIRELKYNYFYLVFNMWKNNWKWNLKRIYKGAKIILGSIPN